MNPRILKIIRILLYREDSVTISYLANNLNVSSRTVTNDLDIVQAILEEYNLELIRKPGVGIYIIGDEKSKLKMLTSIDSHKNLKQEYTPDSRRQYLLLQLLIENRNITISNLQEELFISKSSVYKDLGKVKELLLEWEIDLILDNKNGILIEGGEKRIRKAILEIFFLGENVNYIDDYYSKVYSILLKFQDEFNIKFASDDLHRLTIKYSIAILRIQNKNYVNMKSSTMKELESIYDYSKMSKVIKEMEKEFNILMCKEEVGYLIGLTIGSKTHIDNGKWNVNEKMLVLNKLVAEEIIELTMKYYDISNISLFYRGLTHHLKSVNNKMKYESDFNNPIVRETRAKYPEAFKIAIKSNSIFKDYYGYEIPKEGLTYIALHIAAALERSKNPLSTHIIYHTSYSEIALLTEMLRNYFNQINIEKIVPISMFDPISSTEIDLVISTRKISDKMDGNLVIIPPEMNEYAMVRFSKVLAGIYEKVNYNRLCKIKNLGVII